jgi:hypothetical protein
MHKWFFQCTFIAGFWNNFQAGFGTTFKGTGGYEKAGTSSLKRDIGRNLTISTVSDFIEASRNFILDFLHKKATENCENHKRSFKKYPTVRILGLSKKKYSARDTIPLNHSEMKQKGFG